jgi:hypothetical protein
MPERPGPWDLLDQGSDPVVADLVAYDERVRHFSALAEAMRTQGARLKRIASGEELVGAYADELRDSSRAVSDDLLTVSGRYDTVARALGEFRPALDAALRDSAAALDDAIDAVGAQRSAEAVPEAVAADGAELTAGQRDANEAKAAATEAAAADLAAAKDRLARVLVELDEAGRTAARHIRAGFDDGLTDSWIDRFLAAFKRFLKILVEVLSYIGMALAALAILLPGVGWLIAGAVLGAVALVAEAALFAMGEGSLADLGLVLLELVTLGAAKLVGPALRSTLGPAMDRVRNLGGRRGSPGENDPLLGGAPDAPRPSPAADHAGADTPPRAGADTPPRPGADTPPRPGAETPEPARPGAETPTATPRGDAPASRAENPPAAEAAPVPDRAPTPPPRPEHAVDPPARPEPAIEGLPAPRPGAWRPRRRRAEAPPPEVDVLEADEILTPGARAMQSYLGGGAARLNAFLREGGDDYSPARAAELRSEADLVSGELRRITPAEELRTFRGVDRDLADGRRPGDVFIDNGFLSTARTPDVAQEFVRTGGNLNGVNERGVGTLLTFDSRGVGRDVTHLTTTGEGEVLFDRGTPFEIIDVRPDARTIPDGRGGEIRVHEIRLRSLPQPEPDAPRPSDSDGARRRNA